MTNTHTHKVIRWFGLRLVLEITDNYHFGEAVLYTGSKEECNMWSSGNFEHENRQ